MKREALAAHKSVTGNCPKTRIPCPIEGCQWHGKREDLHDHEKSDALNHVRLIHKAKADMLKKMSEMEKAFDAKIRKAEEKSADMLKKMSEMQKAFDAMSTEQARQRDTHARMERVAFPPFKIEGAAFKPEANGTYFVDLSKGRVGGKPVWKRRWTVVGRFELPPVPPDHEWFVFYEANSHWMITPDEQGIKEGKGCFSSEARNLDFPFEAKVWKNCSRRGKWMVDNDIKITEVGTSDASASTDDIDIPFRFVPPPNIDIDLDDFPVDDDELPIGLRIIDRDDDLEESTLARGP